MLLQRLFKMFWNDIKKLRKEVKELSESQEMLYKSTHLALNRYGSDIRAIIDTLIRKKIIVISKNAKKNLKELEKHRELQKN